MGNYQRQLVNLKQKPYKQCEECLYILNNCVLCKNGNEFFDRVNILKDTVSDTVVEKDRNSTRENRVATQMRDGCNF